MARPRVLRRRTSTPSVGPGVSPEGVQSLPSDLMQQTCHRVWAVGLVATGLWTFSLVMNGLVAPMLGQQGMMKELWPYPMLPIGFTGLSLSLLLVFLAGRLRNRPQLLLDVSAGFQVLVCLLVALVSQWQPPPISPRVSWLCILILAYPAIVTSPPGRTLAVSLLAASMEPVALWISYLRGVAFDHTALYLSWSFLPTYIAALISVVPSKVIRGLGQQVKRARELGSYRLEEVLGKGGMGEVYRASHQMLARPAAVKLIRSEVLGQSAPDHARVMVERFRREAQASASLRSPHTINLYDFGVASDGTFFLVMEMLEGLDLETLVARFGPQPADRTVHLLNQACESLEEAHSRGLIHRDIKPSNIFSCRMGLAVDFVKLLDFGLVKALGEGEKQDVMLTAPNATAGTPAYIAPEVVLGMGTVDHRVDIYALGCVAYWLLTGRLVFEAQTAMQVMIQHANATPVAPSARVELEIPAALDAVVLACLAKNPNDRPASARELALRLSQAVGGTGWTQEEALRWWERHRPESMRPVPTNAGGLTLEKTLGPGWTL